VLALALLPVMSPSEIVGLQTNHADDGNLRMLYRQLQDGWDRGSGAAFASAFYEHADLIVPGGLHIKGRERIASFHQMLFDGILKGSSLVGSVTSVRFLTDDVALIHAIGGPLGQQKRTARQHHAPFRL